MQNNNIEINEMLYENVMNGKLKDQVEIAKQFMKKIGHFRKYQKKQKLMKDHVICPIIGPN